MTFTKPFPKSWEEVPQLVDIPYIAHMLKISPQTIRKFCASGELSAAKIGLEWRIDKDDLQKYLESKKTKRDNAKAI